MEIIKATQKYPIVADKRLAESLERKTVGLLRRFIKLVAFIYIKFSAVCFALIQYKATA